MSRKKKFKAPPPVAYSNEPIMTTVQLAEYYGCEPYQIKQNFNNNADHFEEGKHYFKLEGESLKLFKDRVENFYLVGKNANVLYLWTRRGAARHAKMLNTEKAWEVFEKLEEFYFDYEKFTWNKSRTDGKVVRKKFTDVMEKFYEYAKAQGTSRPQVAFYSYYSKLCNKLAGLPTVGGRDKTTVQQIGLCAIIENGLINIVVDGMEKILPYQEIEKKIKDWAKKFQAFFKPQTFLTSA